MRIRADIAALVVCLGGAVATFAYATGEDDEVTTSAAIPGSTVPTEVRGTVITAPREPFAPPVATYADGALDLRGSVVDQATVEATATELAIAFGVSPDDVRNRLTVDDRAAGATVTVEVGVRFPIPEGDRGGDVPQLGAFLDVAVAVLRQLPEARLVVTGHTDSTGDEALNLTVSQGRAEQVVAAVVARGADPARVVPVGAGEAQPVAGNETADGRAANRRIELRFEGITPG